MRLLLKSRKFGRELEDQNLSSKSLGGWIGVIQTIEPRIPRFVSIRAGLTNQVGSELVKQTRERAGFEILIISEEDNLADLSNDEFDLH